MDTYAGGTTVGPKPERDPKINWKLVLIFIGGLILAFAINNLLFEQNIFSGKPSVKEKLDNNFWKLRTDGPDDTTSNAIRSNLEEIIAIR